MNAAAEAGYRISPDNVDNVHIIYIIDEAQLSYDDGGIWHGSIKRVMHSLPRFGPHFLLLSSFGSRSRGGVDVAGTPLPIVNPDTTIYLSSNIDGIGLCLTTEESNDVRYRLLVRQDRRIAFTNTAWNNILRLSGGHPGGLISIVSVVEEVCYVYRSTVPLVLTIVLQNFHDNIQVKPDLVVNDSALQSVLAHPSFFTRILYTPVGRSLPSFRLVHFGETLPTTTEINIFREILLEGSVLWSDEKAMVRLYKSGHIDQVVDNVRLYVAFPTRLHAL